jgi:hypothetical protein
MLSEKEKLDEELKLLEESFSLEVITKEEYDETKLRIEKKLNSINETKDIKSPSPKEGEEIGPESKTQTIPIKGVGKKNSNFKDDPNIKEPENIKKNIEPGTQQLKETNAQNKDDLKIPDMGESEETSKNNHSKHEKSKISKDFEEIDQEVSPVEKVSSKKIDSSVLQKNDDDDDDLDKIPVSVNSTESTGSTKIYLYGAITVIFIIASYFIFFPNLVESQKNFEALCKTDQDCVQSGSFGKCSNPGTEASRCVYFQDSAISVTLLNARECFNCDKDRLVGIIHNYFPNSKIDEIQVSTEEGQELIKKYKVSSVPAFIFNQSIIDARNYNSFSSAFIEFNGSLIMKSSVANSNYYLSREEEKNRLDIIVKPGQEASESAEVNLQEFLSIFTGVKFNKHLSSSEFAKGLEINSFPTFLVNNKVKFSGVHSAEKIKENFCAMNDQSGCNTELTTILV